MKLRRESQYLKYWLLLKDAPMDTKRVAKVVTLSLPHSIMARTLKAIRKQKDTDFDFKMDNSADPWVLNSEWKPMDPTVELTGHSIVILTLRLERRSDL